MAQLAVARCTGSRARAPQISFSRSSGNGLNKCFKSATTRAARLRNGRAELRVASALIEIPSLSSDVGYSLAYSTIGASAVGFVGTFLVAPKFKSSFKEEDSWLTMYDDLVANGTTTISPEQAKSRRGAVILDVRLASKAAKGMVDNSINIPLYQPIQGWDIASNIRRAGFAFFGIFGTERNSAFVDEVLATVPKNKEVIVLCEMGGSLENKSGTKWGFQSRSLKAIYYLQRAGYNKVYHMADGLQGWQRAELPMTFPDEEKLGRGAH